LPVKHSHRWTAFWLISWNANGTLPGLLARHLANHPQIVLAQDLLQVDMYDAKTKKLIWRGSVEDMIYDKEDKNEKNLDKGVARMFKEFPPGLAKR